MIISSASVAVLVIHCAAIAVTDGVPLNQFFSYGESVGDTTLAKGDDENHPFVAKVPFLFYDKSFTMINVNDNGIMSFGTSESLSYTPRPFPLVSTNIPVIAPFWGDVDNRQVGDIYVRNNSETDTATINKAKSLIATHYEDFPNFMATEVIVLTWLNVSYYKDSDEDENDEELTDLDLKTNTFQCVLATDGTNTFTIFLYLDDGINWTTGDENNGTNGLGGTPALAGFDAGNQMTFRVINGSLTNDIINIEEKSNVGVPGLFIFQVDGFVREAGEEGCPVLGSHSCYERLKLVGCISLNETVGYDNLPSPCKKRLS